MRSTVRTILLVYYRKKKKNPNDDRCVFVWPRDVSRRRAGEERKYKKPQEGLPFRSYEPLNHNQEISRFLKSAAQGIFGL